MKLTLASVALTLTLVAPLAGCISRSIPSAPLLGDAVYDGADALTPAQESAIARAASSRAFASDVRVVTVRRTMDYGAASADTLARRWFDRWRVGDGAFTTAANGRGVLVLVALDDRKARIELGRGWPAGADGEARRIMDTVLVPALRGGDVAGGLEMAAAAVARMEGRGGTRGDGSLGPIDRATAKMRVHSLFGSGGFFGGIAVGALLALVGLAQRRAWLFVVGALIVGVTIYTEIALVLIVVALLVLTRGVRSRSSSRPSRSRWSSRRGASGRW